MNERRQHHSLGASETKRRTRFALLTGRGTQNFAVLLLVGLRGHRRVAGDSSPSNSALRLDFLEHEGFETFENSSVAKNAARAFR